ncbi:hypothetical protein GCM10009528_23620 [Kineococcus aurantiacus]
MLSLALSFWVALLMCLVMQGGGGVGGALGVVLAGLVSSAGLLVRVMTGPVLGGKRARSSGGLGGAVS